jgi:hypothetical protein
MYRDYNRRAEAPQSAGDEPGTGCHEDSGSLAMPPLTVAFFSGLILIMLGVAGEYLRRILDALSDRPEAAIDETFLWTGAAGGT